VRHGTAENRLTDPSKVTDEEVLWYMDHAIFLVSQDDARIVQGFTCANHQTGYIWALFVIDGQHRKGHGSAASGSGLAAVERCRSSPEPFEDRARQGGGAVLPPSRVDRHEPVSLGRGGIRPAPVMPARIATAAPRPGGALAALLGLNEMGDHQLDDHPPMFGEGGNLPDRLQQFLVFGKVAELKSWLAPVIR
jgi:hypothetical protein